MTTPRRIKPYFKLEAPHFIEAAEKLSNNNNIILGEYDGTANENEGVEIKGYPTLKLYKANNKRKPVEFDNPRTVDGIISFMKKHASFYLFFFFGEGVIEVFFL